MNDSAVKALLSLYSVPGIGPVRMRKLISYFGTPQKVLEAGVRRLSEIEGIDNKTAERIKSGINEDFVYNQLHLLKEHNAQVLTFWDESYPDRLKKIYDPPAFLFVKGDISLLNNKAFAIVGTRVPSSYGKAITEQFARELILGHNLTIISGFARGVDTVAHTTALKNNGKTIAVLGNGLDVIYPPENKKIYDDFLKNGLFISEYPFNTKPDAGNFPKRNRIISGLSMGVLITEAGMQSGALLTAMYGLDQNREIFAVPGPITSGKSSGSNNLLKQGAKLVQSIDDIVSELSGQLQASPSVNQKPDLKGKEKIIYELLDGEALHIDQLAIKAGLSTSEILTTLLTMELKGVVRQMAGKMFTRL
ncbi:MAG: DNA-protecting protein DprA [Calditrichae bacterium]|nr:DNA-processing protein DprA [Calditrichota bacterium]MCB9058933.1 DNA-protecting protein DprA [Calditrichia bacterium]